MMRCGYGRSVVKTLRLVALAVTVCWFAVSASAEGVFDDLGIETEGSLDFFSKYVWRGFTLDEDPVIQPGISFIKNGFTVGVWSSWDAKDDRGSQSDEIDYYIDYTVDVNDLISVSLGHTFYDFPATDGKSKELYVGFGLALPVEVSLTWYRDYGDESSGGGDGQYVSLDFAYNTLLFKNKKIGLDLGAHAGYNRKLFLSGKGYDVGVTVGLTIPLTDSLSVSPTVNYVIPYKDLKRSGDGNQDKIFYTGLGFSYSF